MDSFQSLISILSSIVLFLYGLQALSTEIRVTGGEKLKTILSKMTKSPIHGLALGTISTGIIQSSSAVTSLTTTLVNEGVITFQGSLGILLGANIGSTFTAWIVSWKIMTFGPALILSGFLTSLLPWRGSSIGKIIFYFGFIFFALDLVSKNISPIRESSAFIELIQYADSPFKAILVGILATVIIQSSSVVSALSILFVQESAISPEAAIGIVVGSNLGSTATALMASISLNSVARKTALSNVAFNLTGVFLFLPFLGSISSRLLSVFPPDASVAWVHLLFNLSISIIFTTILIVLNKKRQNI